MVFDLIFAVDDSVQSLCIINFINKVSLFHVYATPDEETQKIFKQHAAFQIFCFLNIRQKFQTEHTHDQKGEG